MKIMTHNDILAIEHYDQLSEDQRTLYREHFDSIADQYNDPQAVLAEMKRIDKGMKASCLS